MKKIRVCVVRWEEPGKEKKEGGWEVSRRKRNIKEAGGGGR